MLHYDSILPYLVLLSEHGSRSMLHFSSTSQPVHCCSCMLLRYYADSALTILLSCDHLFRIIGKRDHSLTQKTVIKSVRKMERERTRTRSLGLLFLLLLHTAATEAVISRAESHESLHFSKRSSPAAGSAVELPDSLRRELLHHSRPSPRAFSHRLRGRREGEVTCGLPASTVLEHNPVSL